MSEDGSARAVTPPPKPMKPPKPAPSASSLNQATTPTPLQDSPSISPNRPPPPPGPPPQPGQASRASQAIPPSPPPPPPRSLSPSPLAASPVVQASSTNGSPLPQNQEKREFVNPLRKSSITTSQSSDGRESPLPPPRSPLQRLPPRDSVSSTTSSYYSSDNGCFRPESVMTQMSSVTQQEQDEEAAAGLYPLFENAIKQNVLSKMKRDGKFEKQLFVLTADELIYCHLPTIKPNSVAANAMASITGTVSDAPPAAPVAPPPARKLPLSTLMALPLSEEDRPGKEEKRSRTFKILSKQKSFFVRAPSDEVKDEWMQAIQEAVSDLQGSAPSPVRTVADSAPIYVSTENCCQVCQKVFTFFVRKNHCHNCGKCICEMCSKDKMRIPKIDEKKLFRVCNPCGKELKNTRVYGVRAVQDDA